MENNSELLEMIEMCETKDDLELLIKSEKGVDLDKRGSLKNMKKKAVKLAEGEAAPVEAAPSEAATATVSTEAAKVEEATTPVKDAPKEDVAVAAQENDDEEDITAELDALASEFKEEPVIDSKPAPVVAVRAKNKERFVRTQDDKRVYSWNPHLAKRKDIFDCDIDGNLI